MRSKFYFRKISTLLVANILIGLTFSRQMSHFSRNFNHHWKCREQKEDFQIILVISLWNSAIFQYRLDLSHGKVKRILGPSIANLLYELSHEMTNDLRPRNLQNQETLEKSQIQPVVQSLLQKLNLYHSESTQK